MEFIRWHLQTEQKRVYCYKNLLHWSAIMLIVQTSEYENRRWWDAFKLFCVFYVVYCVASSEPAEKAVYEAVNEEKKHRRKADYEIERHMPKKVIFDFNSVSFMDSAGIGLIIGRYRIANMLGGIVEIANVKDSIKRILELSGILKIIPIIELEEKVG